MCAHLFVCTYLSMCLPMRGCLCVCQCACLMKKPLSSCTLPRVWSLIQSLGPLHSRHLLGISSTCGWAWGQMNNNPLINLITSPIPLQVTVPETWTSFTARYSLSQSWNLHWVPCFIVLSNAFIMLCWDTVETWYAWSSGKTENRKWKAKTLMKNSDGIEWTGA